MSTSGEMSIEKNGRRENNFQNKCVSSKNSRMKNEEGATVAATPYLLSAGRFVGPDGQTETSPNHWERLIKYL